MCVCSICLHIKDQSVNHISNILLLVILYMDIFNPCVMLRLNNCHIISLCLVFDITDAIILNAFAKNNELC